MQLDNQTKQCYILFFLIKIVCLIQNVTSGSAELAMVSERSKMLWDKSRRFLSTYKVSKNNATAIWSELRLLLKSLVVQLKKFHGEISNDISRKYWSQVQAVYVTSRHYYGVASFRVSCPNTVYGHSLTQFPKLKAAQRISSQNSTFLNK